jgi:N-acetylmuramoyl-L-alanine amidase
MHTKNAPATGRFKKVLGRIVARISSRRLIRYGLLAGNVAVLVIIAVLIFGDVTSNQVVKVISPSNLAGTNNAVTNPLDQPSSADIAENLARMARLPETPAVINQVDSVRMETTLSVVGDVVVSKPQAVATALKSKKDIRQYVVVAGDNVGNVAAKFNVTSDSIRWSNSLTGDNLTIGNKLWIPPVNGIVYTVKAGDNPDTLSQKYKSTKEQIIAYNDAEINGLKVGEVIILPGGQQPAPVRSTYSLYSGFAFGTEAIYGAGGYIPGWCTYYVAAKISVPSNWGNANTWDSGARASGWTVSPVPVKGAIGQTDRGSQGHVGIVEDVSADGTMIKYSDMNGLAGFNRVGYSDWVPVHSRFQNFLYR